MPTRENYIVVRNVCTSHRFLIFPQFQKDVDLLSNFLVNIVEILFYSTILCIIFWGNLFVQENVPEKERGHMITANYPNNSTEEKLGTMTLADLVEQLEIWKQRVDPHIEIYVWDLKTNSRLDVSHVSYEIDDGNILYLQIVAN